jgi:hypothetical protein
MLSGVAETNSRPNLTRLSAVGRGDRTMKKASPSSWKIQTDRALPHPADRMPTLR